MLESLPPTAKVFLSIAAGFLVLSVAFDFVPSREATDLDGFERYQGKDLWAIGGVRPGETYASHAARLGSPAREVNVGANRVLTWDGSREFSLTIDSQGRILEAFGGGISAGEKTLVSGGMSQAEVERVLGAGSVSVHRSPSGSGVISLGWKETGRTLTYENGGVRFDIDTGDSGVKFVRATSPPRR